MNTRARFFIGSLFFLITYLCLPKFLVRLDGSYALTSDEAGDQSRWIASTSSWFEKTACGWLGVCGVAHLRRKWRIRHHDGSSSIQQPMLNHSRWTLPATQWLEGNNTNTSNSTDEDHLHEIPAFVLDYAPLVHLYSDEEFWPCDPAEHLEHISPQLNYTPIEGDSFLKLCDLDKLNEYEGGRFVYLTSNDDVEDRPEWLGGAKNIPDIPRSGVDDNDDDAAWAEWDGRIDGPIPGNLPEDRKEWNNAGEGSFRGLGGTRPNTLDADEYIPMDTREGEELIASPSAYPDEEMADDDDIQYLPKVELQRRRRARIQKRLVGGRSDAPAVLIVVPKGDGIVDAFWFYFYSYNLGNKVFNVRFGNHVGDWEHSTVRFKDGVPKAVFFSEHSAGEAYSYEAVEKLGRRPVIYSAKGTHAMYATSGIHTYVLPFGLLHDVTDRGPLWDPRLNSHAYTYDYLTDTLRASNVTPSAPTEWFYFSGHWGDKYYPLSDNRQYRIAGQYHYVNGPLGPRFKNLGRKHVCQEPESHRCVIRDWIGGHTRIRRWESVGEGETMSAEDLERFLGVKQTILATTILTNKTENEQD